MSFDSQTHYMDGPMAGKKTTYPGVPAKDWTHDLPGGKYVLKSRFIHAYAYWQEDDEPDAA